MPIMLRCRVRTRIFRQSSETKILTCTIWAGRWFKDARGTPLEPYPHSEKRQFRGCDIKSFDGRVSRIVQPFFFSAPPSAITGRLNDRHQTICRLNSPSLLVPGEAYVRPVTSIISTRVACSNRLPNRMTVGSKIVFSSYCFTLDPSFHSLQKWIGSEALTLGPIAFKGIGSPLPHRPASRRNWRVHCRALPSSSVVPLRLSSP